MKNHRKREINDCYSHKISNTDGAVTLVRKIQDELKLKKIAQLLEMTPIKFAFMGFNQQMDWVESKEDTQTFWELEVKPHLSRKNSGVRSQNSA